jgi:hypothetical protein
MRGRIKNLPDFNLADLVFDDYFFNYLLKPDDAGDLQDKYTSLPTRRKLCIKMVMKNGKDLLIK